LQFSHLPSVRLEEETARLREQPVRAPEDAALVRTENEYLLELRDAKQQLVVANLRAQTLAEEADQANRLKDEFVSTISHELRTPLTAIVGWARMLRLNQVKTERVPHAVEAIERNAAMLAHLIEDLLDASRIAKGTPRLHSGQVDLVAVAQAALDTIKPAAAAKDIHVQLSAEASSTNLVIGDARRLQQVVWNLLSNAVKFTPCGGRVDIDVLRVAASMEIRISDTGQGIGAEFIPLVFDRFRQANGSLTRREGGLGLGMAIVREIVELHGGHVHAESPGLDCGTTITVTIPILPMIETHRSPDMPRARATTPGATRLDDVRVLVVDDNLDAREVTTVVLEAAGATVTSVSSAREALAVLEVIRPDALVSDIGLPDQDGYALIRQIRRHEAEHGGFLPAIALTAYARAEDRARAIAGGFQAHMAKPAEPSALTNAIAAVTFTGCPRP
jgi:signal transduction histidine kinase/ActR/RegA family two-component response regulator